MTYNAVQRYKKPMKFFADLHLHSKYSRACSKNLDLENLVHWGRYKGVNLFGSADFTHPAWLAELKSKLEENGKGFFKLKGSKEEIYFVLSAELSSIYTRNGKGRRMHYVVLFPDFASVEKLVKKLSLYSNLSSDGRPMLGLDAQEVLKIVFDINADAIFIPAHIWTPWYALFGSESGFDSIHDAFGDLTKYIVAVETGLSSDPAMNWRLSELDPFQIVSFSDAHSPYPHRIGREATIFNLQEPSFSCLRKALKSPDAQNAIEMTIEFYPEEGKYHFDGHRICKVRLSPQESKKHNYRCPVCGKQVTIGVMSRVEKLADRSEGTHPANRPPYKNFVPLSEVIAEILHTQPTTKRVMDIYETLIQKCGNEFSILLGDADISASGIPPHVLSGIRNAQAGNLIIEPGYDGEYGVVRVQESAESQTKSLFV